MPGQPWLSKKTKRGALDPQAERQSKINAGLRQEHREGVSPTAPVNEERALAAEGRARAASAGPGASDFAHHPPAPDNLPDLD